MKIKIRDENTEGQMVFYTIFMSGIMGLIPLGWWGTKNILFSLLLLLGYISINVIAWRKVKPNKGRKDEVELSLRGLSELTGVRPREALFMVILVSNTAGYLFIANTLLASEDEPTQSAYWAEPVGGING